MRSRGARAPVGKAARAAKTAPAAEGLAQDESVDDATESDDHPAEAAEEEAPCRFRTDRRASG